MNSGGKIEPPVARECGGSHAVDREIIDCGDQFKAQPQLSGEAAPTPYQVAIVVAALLYHRVCMTVRGACQRRALARKSSFFGPRESTEGWRSGVDRGDVSVLFLPGILEPRSAGVDTDECRCGEMADATDLKSVGEQSPCGFESHHRYLSLKISDLAHSCSLKMPQASTKASTLPLVSP